MGCINCGSGFCELCEECSCCKPKSGLGRSPEIPGNASDDRRVPSEVPENSGMEKGSGGGDYTFQRAHKSDEDIRDPGSTGRKRAALLFPIVKDAPCEWQGLTNCGGGQFPVVGCVEGKQRHIHHGPDKNTLNNSRKNIHLICHHCHNIWHSQNDPNYDTNHPDHKQHEPRKAELVELAKRYGGEYRAKPQGDVLNETI